MNISTLLEKTNTQRIYLLSFRIRNVFNLSKTIKETFKDDPPLLKKEYELAEDISESINKICISDAHTHIERLVFPAFEVREKKTGKTTIAFWHQRIHGYWTFKIYGGDSRYVYPDGVYIRHLRMINR